MTLTDNGIPRWMLAEGNKIKDFDTMENVETKKSNIKSISPGTERNTRGILFWNKPFVITRKNGERICILLMDTQGLWDSDTKNEFNCSIFGLSSLISSYAIFNQKGNMNTDQLKKFSVLSKFSKEVSKKDGKPFQHLDFLLRDFEYYDKRTSIEQGIQLGINRLNKMHSKGAELDVVKEIEECFNEFDMFCFPSPGEDVMNLDYEGSISEIKPQFMQMLSYYIDRVIQGDGVRKGIEPRKIGGETITVKTFVE